MSLLDIVAALIEERGRIDRAIEVLGGPSPRRGGRPPKNPTAIVATATPSTDGRRRGMSPAARKALSAKLRAAWARRKKAASAEAKKS
jgi:hypothetical protein